MAVRDPRLEPRRHARTHYLLAGVGDERHLALEHVHELVLLRVPVTLRRPGARPEPAQVHAEVREAERVTERALGAVAARRVEGRRIGGAGLLLYGGRIERGHGTPQRPWNTGFRFSLKAFVPSRASSHIDAGMPISSSFSSASAVGRPRPARTERFTACTATGPFAQMISA